LYNVETDYYKNLDSDFNLPKLLDQFNYKSLCQKYQIIQFFYATSTRKFQMFLLKYIYN